MAESTDEAAPVASGALPDVPQSMIQQAGAAALGERDPASKTESQRRHQGHDVSMADARPGESDTMAAEQTLPQPAYGERYGTIENDQAGFATRACVNDDGRVGIRINQRNRRLSELFAPALKHQQSVADREQTPPPPYVPPSLGGTEGNPPPPMNVVIHVVGSRGDIQPFVALGKVLKNTYRHRVRLATHFTFKDFVTENGLEFFSIGGDPAALMAFMVKNPGLMPGFDSLRAGDVGKRRKEVAEYLRGCWRSCFETGDGTGPEASDDTINDLLAGLPDGESCLHKPFVADCIIANPPSFAHIHCAEKLGIPLHVMFTMPYSPTQAFPHPLADIQSSNADDHLTNYISYTLIEMLTWQGLGDVINRFRQKSLGLEPISLMWAPGILQRLKIPHTYAWSPALIPKPRDWGSIISVSGFFFLDLATSYTPDPELKAFLDAGPPPVYIGFGSIVLDDPNTMTKLLFEAIRKTGQRALVSKGWGGMGADELGKPDNVYMLGNVPHDWLFKHVSCVVHHGGAGTTAAGITAGRPTVVVPFFGDQMFWGSMVAKAGAGPNPIPNKKLTADNLAEAILECLKPSSQEKAQELAASIAQEKGSDVGAQKFHQFLDVDKMRCNLSPSRAAVWRIKRTQVRLSAFAACTLANEGLLDFNDIKLYRPREYATEDSPWDPVTGGASALIGTIGGMMMGFADFPAETLKALRIHPDAVKGDGPKSGSQPGSPGPSTSRSSEEHSTGTRTASPAVTAPTSPPPLSTSRTSSSFNLDESLSTLTSTPSLGPQKGGPPMASSMADALRGQLSSSPRPRSSSNSGTRSRGTSMSNPADMIQTSIDTGKGAYRVMSAGFKAPMDFTLGVAKGFHNAPKLYGDDTVREHEHVTDFKSGLAAATRGFGYGMYDGITGLVTQPMQGAQKEGAAGFLKGIGKGIGGVVLKPGAAFFGIPGYTMKGVYKEMKKYFGSSVINYIIAARTAQGYEEWQQSSADERGMIVERWQRIQQTLKKKRNPDELVRDILEEQMRKKEGWIDSRKANWAERRHSRSRASSTSGFRRIGYFPGYKDTEREMLAVEAHSNDHRHRSRTMSAHAAEAEAQAQAQAQAHAEAIDETIRLSVQHTSNGDHDEDAEVERGIRASLEHLQRQRTSRADQHEEDELRRALAESTLEHEQRTQAQSSQPHDAKYDYDLERALARSLREHRGIYESSDDEQQASSSAKATPAAEESGPSTSSLHPPPPAYDDPVHDFTAPRTATPDTDIPDDEFLNDKHDAKSQSSSRPPPSISAVSTASSTSAAEQPLNRSGTYYTDNQQILLEATQRHRPSLAPALPSRESVAPSVSAVSSSSTHAVGNENDDDEHDEDLQRAIRASLSETQ